MKRGCGGVDDELRAIIENDEEFDEALFQLEQFSLAKRMKREGGESIEVHRLVQAFLQDEVLENDTIG